MYRAILISGTSLATYDTTKSIVSKGLNIDENGLLNRFLSSVVTGFLSSVVTSPIDVVKTRYMNANKDPHMPKFKGPADCALQMIRNEGVMSFYNGFILLWLRLGPWAVIMFMSWDWCKDVSKKYLV